MGRRFCSLSVNGQMPDNMDTGKPTRTPADYMVLAASPVLIMALVHSVCFFLVDVFYRGEGSGGARWVLFWFVLAVVLITRIGIEQGDTQAMAYGLLLAVATWFYLSVVQHSPVFGALLLGIVWFTAHKITSNCTLIDDEADASGQGLMQSLRRLPKWFKRASGSPNLPEKSALQTDTPPAPPRPQVRIQVGTTRRASPPVPEKKARKSSSQVPGIWLIYYSLAALPIFGLGQTLLPAGDLAARHRGFVYLFCYLAAALGLLITTSFLGLRRYLRQRYVVMPAKIALGWVQFGVVGALIVLCASLLMPRPGAGEAWGTLRYHVDNQLRRASQYAARFNPHGQGSGRTGNQSPPGDQPAASPSSSGQTPSPDQNDNSSAKSPDSQKAGTASEHGAPPGQAGGEKPEPPMPGLAPTAGPLYVLFKLLFYLTVITVALWLLYRYRVMVLAMLRNDWAAIRNIIAALLALFRPSSATASAASRKAEVRPFKSFKNPFLTGANRIWPPAQLIACSYEALQSWALEAEDPASPQTPREFCRRLGEELPEAAAALEHLAFMYGHVAYGASVPGSFDQDHLRLLWDYMALPRIKNPRTMDDAMAGNK